MTDEEFVERVKSLRDRYNAGEQLTFEQMGQELGMDPEQLKRRFQQSAASIGLDIRPAGRVQ